MKTLDCINVGMMALIIILCSFNLSSEAGKEIIHAFLVGLAAVSSWGCSYTEEL